MSLTDRITEIQTEAEQAIGAATTTADLEALRLRFLGRKAELPNLLRGVADLEPAERGAVGKAANQTRRALERLIGGRTDALAAVELEAQLERDWVDITLPGTPARPVGSLHVLHQTWRELEDVFLGLGFTVLDGPEVELVQFNFDALNHDPAHPARAWTDTFYVEAPDGTAGEVVMRTHTSPMQVRAMQQHAPPLYVVIPGRVYRRDHDATHLPQFHQVEGLAVDEDITLADLKGTLLSFAQTVFGDERKIRLRPHFFPFTEPSVEIDVSCSNCREGSMRDGSRCPVCKGTTWLEVLGAGMVDPNVLRAVGRDDYDLDRVQGFAFGLGIERIAMLKHRIPDLRLYIENDVRFLEQFG